MKTRGKQKSQLVKLPIIHPTLGEDFLAQLKLHWSCVEVGHEEMT
jgi:hypothetical protein